MFALINDNIVREIFEVRPDFHSSLEIVEIPMGVEVGWIRNAEGQFGAPPPPPEPIDPPKPTSHQNQDITGSATRSVLPIDIEELGYFGNIWVRAHYFAKAGDTHQGHTHTFDHVSFLTRGSVRVVVDGLTTDYAATNFIVIDKNKEHSIQALEDQTEWWCVFAVRETNGEVADIVNPDKHDPSHFAR